MTRTEYKQMWDRFQRRQEAIFTRVFKTALRTQLEQYFATGQMQSQPIREALIQLYNTVGPSWAAKTGVARKKPIFIKSRMPMGFSERIVQLMREYYGDVFFLNEAEGITDTSRERIIAILNDAATSGIGIDDIIKQFPADFGAIRARRIARTEVVSSSNQAAILNAKDTGVPMNKKWLAINDRRTRHSHLAVDNATVGLDDYFNVGGAIIPQPGAKIQKDGTTVPGSQVINCRCVLGFVVIKSR